MKNALENCSINREANYNDKYTKLNIESLTNESCSLPLNFLPLNVYQMKRILEHDFSGKRNTMTVNN